jgi:hypothetical protein
LIADLEVDMQSISVSYNTDMGALLAEVKMESPLVNDYSFAVVFYVLDSQGDANSFLWEVHDKVYRLGQMDAQTGTVISETIAVSNTLSTTDGLLIEHDTEKGVVSFNLPDSRLLDENVYVAVRSFHTGVEGQPVNCDQAGSFELPELMWRFP